MDLLEYNYVNMNSIIYNIITISYKNKPVTNKFSVYNIHLLDIIELIILIIDIG